MSNNALIGLPSNVAAVGDIDVSTAPNLLRDVDAAVAAGTTHLRIDLSHVTFMDAAGVSVLIHARNTLTKDGVTLLVGPVAMRVLDVCRLGAAFRTATN